MEEIKKISRKHKYLFWLNLGLISTFFAEVISGSDLFPFFHVWGISMVVPIYLLHTMILITLVYRFGQPTFPVLYFAGTLFGLYEAYITKILWNPSWEEVFKIADVAVFEVIVLVLFWHAWMSFILPLIAADIWLLGSNEMLSLFPQQIRRFFATRKGWGVVAILGGLFLTINLPAPGYALVSGLGVITVLGFFGWLWRKITKRHTYTFADLLPNKCEFIFLTALLLGIYLITGFTLRPEALPSLLGHLVIWTFYALSLIFLITALRYSRKVTMEKGEFPLAKESRFWFWGLLLFFIAAFVLEGVSHLFSLEGVIGFICWYGVAVLGVFMLIWALRTLFKEKNRMKKLSTIMVFLTLLLIFMTACRNTEIANRSVSAEMPAVTPSEFTLEGNRILQMDVKEASDGDYDAAMQIAINAGAEAVSMSLGWDDIETAPGEFNPETNWLEIANAYYPMQEIAVSLVINPIDTNVDRRPQDLRDKDYDDPQVIARYNALLDYIHIQIPDLQLVSLSIGNEIDATLGDDAEAWQQYTNFFAATSVHARTLWPDVPVGSKVMYSGAMGESTSYVQALTVHADIVMITYYPLDAKFQVQDPAEAETDLQKLVTTFEGKDIVLAEVGYPSSEVNGSSMIKQAKFVHHMFVAWDKYADRIKLISFTFQTDMSPERVSDLEAYYGFSNKAFAEYLHTLGLRTYDGKDKLAWKQLVAEAEARGW
jgi:hypothetical protein